MTIGEKIKSLRKDKKITQKQLAEELTQRGRKTSNTAIANWESGLNSPDVDTVQLMCQIFEKDGNYFFDTNNDINNDFRYASYNGINTDGLDESILESLGFEKIVKSDNQFIFVYSTLTEYKFADLANNIYYEVDLQNGKSMLAKALRKAGSNDGFPEKIQAYINALQQGADRLR